MFYYPPLAGIFLSLESFEYLFPEAMMLVLGVERPPNLGKERIAFRYLVVVPRRRQAIGAPVSAFQDKGWRSLELVSELAFPP